MPVTCRGFSLPETLIAMAISSVLLLGSARFLPALQWATLRQTRQQSLETLRGASACSGKGWEKMTNPAAIQVTAFQVTRLERAGFSPELSITLAAHSVADPQIRARAEYAVTGYNL